jgi:exportin-1
VKTPRIRGLRSIKSDILKLIDTYIECTNDLTIVHENMVEPFLDVILSDYNNSVDIARDAGVLDVVATTVNKLGVSQLQV